MVHRAGSRASTRKSNLEEMRKGGGVTRLAKGLARVRVQPFSTFCSKRNLNASFCVVFSRRSDSGFPCVHGSCRRNNSRASSLPMSNARSFAAFLGYQRDRQNCGQKSAKISSCRYSEHPSSCIRCLFAAGGNAAASVFDFLLCGHYALLGVGAVKLMGCRGGFQGGCLSAWVLRCACNRHGACHIDVGHRREWASFAKC